MLDWAGAGGTCVCSSSYLCSPSPRVTEQRDQRQLPDQGENGEDPYAGSTDENTDNEAQPESPDLPVPELPGRDLPAVGSVLDSHLRVSPSSPGPLLPGTLLLCCPSPSLHCSLGPIPNPLVTPNSVPPDLLLDPFTRLCQE